MNDDELIERLRRTLHDHAESLQPTPGALPTPDEVARASGRLVGPGEEGLGTGPTGGDRRYRADTDERQTAEYVLLPPTGPVPIFGRGNGRRWPPLVGLGALAAAAAAIVAAVVLTGGRHPLTTGPAGTQSPSPTTVVTRPATTTPAPTTAVRPQPATTVAPPPADVPAGFEPDAVTFVSPYEGWVLGRDPGGTGSCATLARTIDGGYHWTALTAPTIDGSCGSGAAPMSLRFADAMDGWVYTAPGPDGTSQLWSTHDGGTSWTAVRIPLTGATIAALEAAGGHVQMVVYGPCPDGTTGCRGQTVEQLLTSPVGYDEWTSSPLQPSIGAGPALSPELTLWGTVGWLVNTNRTVVSGAELSAGSKWSAWTPPCSSAHGAGVLAAASGSELAAVCAEGVWGPPDTGTTAGHDWLFLSDDAGATFHAVAALPGDQPLSVTTPPGQPQTIVVADGSDGLIASFNGGTSWSTVEPGLSSGSAAASGNLFSYVGFTTPTQGVAISTQPTPTLYVTRDGGHDWTAVSF